MIQTHHKQLKVSLKSLNEPTTQPLLTQAYILFHAKIVTNITSAKPNAIYEKESTNINDQLI